MNLTKLFNLSYWIENMKKSKPTLILLMLLVPLFTSVLLLSVEDNYLYSFVELSSINLIGLYIIPFVLSTTLFGYVYKKNSVDFIGSMPISRTSIFSTNTIGGIAFITLMQILTAICTILLSKILSNVTIFGSMVWDILVFYTLGYIFVFTAANLAMTFSGNKITQIISTILIIFVVPFLIVSGRLYYENEYRKETVIEQVIEIDESYHFTAPAYVFDIAINGNDFIYDGKAVLRMAILSCIYIGLGVYLFKRKKLEMAGEAYETRNIHLIVKLLTLLPFMAIFCGLSNSDRASAFLFFIAIVSVYYFVFDLITNKKIKLRTTIPAFLGSLAILFAFYEGIAPNFSFNNVVKIKPDEIKSIYIEDIQSSRSTKKAFGLLIEDEELVKLLSKKFASLSNYRDTGIYSEYTEEYYDDILVTTEIKTNEEKKKVQEGSNANMILRLKNGKEYQYSDYIKYEIWEKIFEKYGTQKFTQEFDKKKIVLRNVVLSEKEQKEILEVFNKSLNNITYEEAYKLYQSDDAEYTLYLYEYKNHEMKRTNYSKKMPVEIFEKIVSVCNEKSLENLDEATNFYTRDEGELLKLIQIKEPNIKDLYITDEYGGYYDLMEESTEEILDFIARDSKNKFDVQKEYIVLQSYYPTYTNYYTNNIEGVANIITNKYYEIMKNIGKIYIKE